MSIEKIKNSNWEPILTTQWDFEFKTPFDNDRYNQFKKCFDNYINNIEKYKNNTIDCLFPSLKQINCDFNVNLISVKPIKQ